MVLCNGYGSNAICGFAKFPRSQTATCAQPEIMNTNTIETYRITIPHEELGFFRQNLLNHHAQLIAFPWTETLMHITDISLTIDQKGRRHRNDAKILGALFSLIRNDLEIDWISIQKRLSIRFLFIQIDADDMQALRLEFMFHLI